MKLTCLQENLKRGLSIVSHAVAGKSTLPVLSNILLATDNGRLKLAATNLELGITCWIGSKVDREGAVTIPAKLLSDLVGSLPNDRITLELDSTSQSVKLMCHRRPTKKRQAPHRKFAGPTKNKSAMTLGRKPHHTITIRTYVTMELSESSASEFWANYYIRPYALLNNSAWKPLLNIYEKMRVKSYNVKMYLPRQSILDKGRVVSFLERDSAPAFSATTWSYGKLLEMPGRKERNNLVGKSNFHWSPIDPEDYEYKATSSAFDDDTYGVALFAGWVGAAITTKPVIEVSLSLDFVDLLTAPALAKLNAMPQPQLTSELSESTDALFNIQEELQAMAENHPNELLVAMQNLALRIA